VIRPRRKVLSLLVALALASGCAGSGPRPAKPAAPTPRSSAGGSAPAAPAPAVPAPQPVAPQPQTPLPAIPERRDPEAPILVRVGLASDLAEVTFPCCEENLAAASDEGPLAVSGPLKVEPAGGTTAQGVYRLQVAALRDEQQALDLARRLAELTGKPGDAHFDAGIDLYRVRVGRYASRDEAESDSRRLGTLGVTGAFLVYDGGDVDQPALRLTQAGVASLLPGRWLAVAPAGGVSVRVNGKRYRGRMLVYLNDRGTLNLINELQVEDYLRGVVPSEMGPEQYNQLEALKAQAVAARTYTLRNLGEFGREGYDICATPRCQVYKGMGVEHPLSDRAIAETAGQVLLYQGDLVDALYSSTCGGHTESAKVIFPFKDEPYLAPVPCMEAGLARLEGTLEPGIPFPEGLTLAVIPRAPGVSPVEALHARLEHLALLAGMPAPRERLRSLDRREVQRFVASTFDFALDARLFLSNEDVKYLLHDPPRDWSEDDLRRAAYLIRSGLLSSPLDQPLTDPEIERMLLALGELLGVLAREQVSFLSVDGNRLTVRSGKEDRVVELPPGLATFRLRGDSMTSAPLSMVPGDSLTLFRQGERLLGITQEVDLDGVAFDRSSPYSSWTRFRTDSQLSAQVATRLPGLGFHEFEVIERGTSGRVGKIRIHGEEERVADIDGLAIRWTLDVPDTLFTVKRLTPKGREAGWLFTGRGFGHGVGMCQVGAYGMAQRGHSYREILAHYYTGVELGKVRWKARPATTSP
jgi:stage II sporulation protein D